MKVRLVRGKAYKLWTADRDNVVTNGDYTYRIFMSLGDLHLSHSRFRSNDL